MNTLFVQKILIISISLLGFAGCDEAQEETIVCASRGCVNRTTLTLGSALAQETIIVRFDGDEVYNSCDAPAVVPHFYDIQLMGILSESDSFELNISNYSFEKFELTDENCPACDQAFGRLEIESD